jgi:hypothetical protein
MAAPRGATYQPKSGPLAGRIFVGTPGTSQAYNRYQEARSHHLGFASYRDERSAKQSPAYKALISGERTRTGKPVNAQQRTGLLRIFAQERKIETVVEPGKRVRFRSTLDVDFSDHRRGGSYDMYLRRIGRRVGNEEWLPGETP